MSWYTLSNLKLQLQRLDATLVGANLEKVFKGHIPPRLLPKVAPPANLAGCNVNPPAPAVRPAYVPQQPAPRFDVRIQHPRPATLPDLGFLPDPHKNLKQPTLEDLNKLLARTEKLWHINNDRTAAVSDVQFWLPIDSYTPKGVKIQLLTSGGVAIYAHYYGEKFWKGWAPLPKVDKRPASLGEN